MASRSLPSRAASGVAATIVGAFTVLDMTIGPVLRPFTAAVARSSPIALVRTLSRRLPAYVALVFLLVPLAIAEPAKIFALYLIGEGHYISGVLTMAAAYVVSLFLVDTIYEGARPQLRSIAWFALLIDRIVAVRITVMTAVRASTAYQSARGFALRVRARIRRLMKPAT